MNKLNRDKRVQIIETLVEGVGVNATARLCKVSKLTILRLLADVGQLCRNYHDLAVRGIATHRIQVDELWSFVGCKQKIKDRGGCGDGDCWTWVGIDADTKLVVSYMAGLRDVGYATEFMRDLADRLVNRVQLTTDAYGVYLQAVPDAFGEDVDFATLVKIYGKPEGPYSRQSLPQCIGCKKRAVTGNPDPAHVSTSYIERQNLTVRMSNRRFTRDTNAFSKRWINHEHSIALHYFYYNFCRKHATLGVTPAQKAGLTDRRWTVADMVDLWEQEELKQNTSRWGTGGRINREDRT